jgi:hypothetical protein
MNNIKNVQYSKHGKQWQLLMKIGQVKPSGRQFNLHIYFLVHSLFGQNKLHGGSEYPLFAAQFVSDILSSMFFRDHQFDQLTRKRGKQKRKKGDVSKPNEPARGI